MKTSSGDIRPNARKENLVFQELTDEMLVYDYATNEAHCLNRTASLVLKKCDGRTSVAEITKILQKEVDTRMSQDVVMLALDRLEKTHLLEKPVRHRRADQTSRRDVLRKLGWAAAVSLPLVTSIVAPTAASAATCIPEDQCGPGKCDVPCHTTGSTDCTKVCRPRANKAENCNGAWQCVGNPAGVPCPC